jgi:two-component system, cell cycle sensor histidine kinase and response regulator CckA
MGAIGSSDRKTILVVEDDDSVRGFLHAFLRNAGYEVLVAATGQRAIDLAQSHAGAIHLLVCHWFMREIDGPSVATRIEAVRPGLKVILLSASDPGVPVKSGWTFFLKPFDRLELLEKVGALLSQDGRQSASPATGISH